MPAGLMHKLRNFFTFEEDEFQEELEPEKSRWRGKLVSLASPKHNAIVLMEPASIQEAQTVGDHLKNRAAVLVNLHGLEHETAVRILDFMSGVAYALNGSIQKISEVIFLFAPSTYTIIAKRQTV